jgi:restriction endonuclease Mrr
LATQLLEFKTFPHLAKLDGGEEKVRRAKDAVEQLRTLVEPHQAAQDEEAAIKVRQKKAAEKLRENAAVRTRLDALKQKYLVLATSGDPQARGYDLERLLYDLFELFDLDPKASFRNSGEQIDGAFSLEGTDYLFEARWRKEQSDIGQLDSFAGKVTRKLENTLGVFLAISGFSQDGIDAHSKGRPSIILMDGADLMAVLEERIDFVVLLLRKRRHAAHTGEIYLRVHEIL